MVNPIVAPDPRGVVIAPLVTRTVFVAALLFTATFAAAAAGEPAPPATSSCSAIDATWSRALSASARDVARFEARHACVACHVHAPALAAFGAARRAGATVDDVIAPIRARLVAAQRDDGAFGDSRLESPVMQTVLATWALSRVDGGDATLAPRTAALQRLWSARDASRPDRIGWRPDHPLGGLAHEEAMTALVADAAARFIADVDGSASADPAALAVATSYRGAFEGIATLLLDRAHVDNGATVFSAWHLIGLQAARDFVRRPLRDRVDMEILRVADRLATWQLADGAYPYVWWYTDGDALSTAWSGLALLAIGIPSDDPAIDRAAVALARLQRDDGHWRGLSPAFETDGPVTATVALFLATLREARRCPGAAPLPPATMAVTPPDASTRPRTGANRAPVVASYPPAAVRAGHTFTYDFDANDPDGDAPAYVAAQAPAGFAIDAASGVAWWTPTEAEAGNHDITLLADDGHGGVVRHPFVVAVVPTDMDADAIAAFARITTLARRVACIGAAWRDGASPSSRCDTSRRTDALAMATPHRTPTARPPAQ